MKRLAAALIFLISLSLLVKLARSLRESPADAMPGKDLAAHAREEIAGGQHETAPSLFDHYPNEAELIARVVDRYQHTALRIHAAEGLRGLRLLDRLDLDAVFLFEKHPREFQRLAAALNDAAAADLILHWREYFGWKRNDDLDRRQLIEEISRLSPSNRHLAARYPAALPLILAEPAGVSALLRRLQNEPQQQRDALAVLDLMSLDSGVNSIKRALETLELRPNLALEAFRQFGPEGFALVTLYGDILDALSDSVPLSQALILLKVNSVDVDRMLASQTHDFVANHVRHLVSRGLAEAVGSTPHGLRLSAEYQALGDLALERAGSDAADVVYENFDDPLLRDHAVRALAEYGSMAAAMLAKYAADPDFQTALRTHGAAVIPPIARADVAPEVLLMLQSKDRKSWSESLAQHVLALSGENGQAAIRLICKDGLARVNDLQNTEVGFPQFLPLYDLIHLGSVLTHGHTPTSGEMAWAAIDGAFVILDVVSLAALQPGALTASETARTEVKATARTAVRLAGRELGEEALQSLGGSGTRAARWWAVRTAGGAYHVLLRTPEALQRMSLGQLSDASRALCRKAGLVLSTWTPMHLARDGQTLLLRVPTDRWSKYVGINIAQAGVGVVAMHKMEELLGSKRPGGTE